MSFRSELSKMTGCSKTLIESALSGYKAIYEASNTQIKNAVSEGKRIAMQDLVDNLPNETGGQTVREYLMQNPWTADMQGVPRDELHEYYDAFMTRGSADAPSRDKTMAEQTRDEIAAKVLHFRGGEIGYAYLPGIVRIAIEDMLYGSNLTDTDGMKKLASFIHTLVTEYGLPNDCAGAEPGNPFDRYLNNMTWDEIESEYGRQIDDAQRSYHNTVQTYIPDAGNVEHAGQYDIIRVRSFAEARQYRNLDCPSAPMCIASGRAAWDQHADNGNNTVYLVRRRDALEIPPEPGPDAPLDDYGLSAFYVIVDPDGDPVSITPRWNHAQEATDYSISPQLASDLVGMPFGEAFPPDPTFNGGMDMQPPPGGMPEPIPRPADRPYIHGWHPADDYMPGSFSRRIQRMRGAHIPGMGRPEIGGPRGNRNDGRMLPPGGRPGLPPPDRMR